MDERAKLLQLTYGASLQHVAVVFEELIVWHPQFRARSQRTFLREQLIQIAESGSASFIRPGTVTGQFARERIRPFDARAGGKLRAA